MAAPVAKAQKAIAKSAGIPVREQHLMCHDRPLSANEILGVALGEDDEARLPRVYPFFPFFWGGFIGSLSKPPFSKKRGTLFKPRLLSGTQKGHKHKHLIGIFLPSWASL